MEESQSRFGARRRVFRLVASGLILALAMLEASPSLQPSSRLAAASTEVPVVGRGTRTSSATTPARRQRRAHGVRVVVDPKRVWVNDGDTFLIRWRGSGRERIRILGIDAPELRNAERGLLEDQPYGREALAFARHAFAEAQTIEIVRAATPDGYGRTLAYAFLDGRNYSVMAIEAHLAEETISRFGTNGLRREAAAVREAALRAGPPPFMSPAQWKRTR